MWLKNVSGRFKKLEKLKNFYIQYDINMILMIEINIPSASRRNGVDMPKWKKMKKILNVNFINLMDDFL